MPNPVSNGRKALKCDIVLETLTKHPALCKYDQTISFVESAEYVSTQILVNPHWAGPSVIVDLAPDSTPDKAE